MDRHPMPELPLWQRYYAKNYSPFLQKFVWITSNIKKHLFESQNSSARKFLYTIDGPVVVDNEVEVEVDDDNVRLSYLFIYM